MSATKPVQGPLTRKRKVGAVMVVGGGPGGMEASLNLANAGFKVYLLEKEGAIGGRMAQLDKTFPTNDCSMCIISPKLVEVGKHMNIEILTNSQIESIEGEEGSYRVKVLRKAAYIDPNVCTGCGECFDKCPVSLPNEFDENLSTRKAVFKRYPQAMPSIATITKSDRAPCVLTCPANVNIQGYVALIAAGKYQEALEVIKQRNPLPSVCGRVCYHPCESKCNRGEIDEPVAINPLKRFVADKVREMRRKGELTPPERPKKGLVLKHKVAVIGSGPAGLTAAYDLAMQDYPVTIFEAMPKPGGMLYYGIPSWRLPKDILLEEIKEIEDLGVEIKTGVSVGKDITFDDIKKQGYRAIFIATGAWKGRQIPIGGDSGEGVLQGVDFLRDLAMGTFPEKTIKGRKVLVVGGGNVAMDVARAAVRLGAERVRAACLECSEEMPAHEFEIEQAREEGVEIHNSWGPEKILRSDGKVTGMDMKKCTRVFDEEGRFAPEFDACTLESFDADVIILSVGQAPTADKIDIGGESVDMNRGLIQVDPLTLETNVAGVFAGGDGVTGPRSTIEAINQGHEAALSIDRFLTRKDLKQGREKPEREPAPVPPDRVFLKQPRETVEELTAEERRSNFKEIETTITEEQALREARRCLNCGLCCECKQCVEACGVQAINHDMTDRFVDLDVGSVILAPGFDLFDSQLRGEYGYGIYKNVVTSMEFERILSASGPFGGHVIRPSDHEEPKKMAWIQCVGSRDVTCGRGYCSSVCCMYATKEAIMAIDHVPGLEATIFYNDMRTYGKGYELYYESAKDKFGVKFNRGIVSSVKELQQSKNLLVKFIGEDGKVQETELDMLVLSTGLVPCEGTRQLAERVGVDLNEFGFCKTELLHPGETSRKGVYVAGVFESPKDIPETVSSSCSAAGLAAMNLSEARGTLVKEKHYPQERDVSSEELRIGVFVCHCGTNIGGVVDVPRAVEYAKVLPNVAHAQRFTYTCSSDSQQKIVEAIKEHRLNRVVVASCTPRTHEPLFQDCLREAGINKYLFEMANIREQCSWVHKPDMEKANLKAHDLIRMAVTRASRLEQLKDFTVSVNQKALVIGGGVAGMNAALNLASQGFQTTIVEKADELGGNMARVRYLLDGSDPRDYVRGLVEAVEKNPRIKVYTGSRVIDFAGHKGNMKSVIASNGTKITVDHGVVVVATGGVEHKPQEYLYGQNDRVMTQLEFESLMAEREKDAAAASSVVMIQCVGSRDKEHPFCSRVCCQQAIKNAIHLKKLNPETDVTVLYRDIRTYGLFETWYKEARDLGVLFVRYDEDEKPQVTEEDGRPVVTVRDTATGFNLRFEPDYLVLSAGIRPNPDNDAVGAMLKVPRNPDGFFLEAHMKLRPLDFTTEGAYLCGLAHSPKNVSDSIVQARGAAARAAVVLSRDTMVVSGTVSQVLGEQCVACLTCVRTCPYGAPHINEKGVAEIEVAACQGCGNCAAACPRKAIVVAHYKDDQITSKIDGLFADLEGPPSLAAGK